MKTDMLSTAYGRRPTQGKKPQNNKVTINPSDIKQISAFTSQVQKSNENIMTLFPDIELAIQILVSSIISPNNINISNILYNLDADYLTVDTKDKIVNQISDTIKYYGLGQKLPTIVREALMTTGAYVEAVIPQNSLASIGLESLGKTSLSGFIKSLDKSNTNKFFIENISLESNVSLTTYLDENDLEKTSISQHKVNASSFISDEIFTDDYRVLHFPTVESKRVSLESRKINKNKAKKEFNNFYKIDSIVEDAQNKEFMALGTKKESAFKNKGMPIIMKLPVESVVPVHNSTDPSDHLGYFVILDNNGSPIKDISTVKFEDDQDKQQTYQTKFKNKSDDLLNKASASLKSMLNKEPVMKNVEEVYNQILTDKINNILSNSIYGNISETDLDMINKVYFKRLMASKKTKILFLPKELVTYYTFKYRDNGTGESALENVNVLSSIRAVTMFASIMRKINNSFTNKRFKVTLDDEIADPIKQMEMVKAVTLASMQNSIPIGFDTMEEVGQWCRTYGLSFEYTHKNLPSIQIDTEYKTQDSTAPDEDMDQKLLSLILMSFGLNPEAVTTVKDEQYATSLVNKNILFTKRVTALQDIFIPILSDHIRKLINHNATLVEGIKELVLKDKEYKKFVKNRLGDDIDSQSDEIAEDFIEYMLDDFHSTLPRPEVDNSEELDKSFDVYVSRLEDILEHVATDYNLPEEIASEINGIDGFIDMVKQVLILKWCENNNYMPEVVELFANKEDFRTLSDLLDRYTITDEAFSKEFVEVFKKKNRTSKKYLEKIEKISNGEDPDDPEPEPSEEPEPTTGTSDDDVVVPETGDDPDLP